MSENVFIEDSGRAMSALTELREMGLRLAIDDFGTGYSSLSYLRRLPVNIVKIDQSFISGFGGDRTAETIVESVTNLSHLLGLAVVAEGVETMAQRDAVERIGCESSQGYFYARPMPAASVRAALVDRTGPLRLPQPRPGGAAFDVART